MNAPSQPSRYQLIRRGDQYAIRWRGPFGLDLWWVYVNLDYPSHSVGLAPDWMSESLACGILTQMEEADRLKAAPVEIVDR